MRRGKEGKDTETEREGGGERRKEREGERNRQKVGWVGIVSEGKKQK